MSVEFMAPDDVRNVLGGDESGLAGLSPCAAPGDGTRTRRSAVISKAIQHSHLLPRLIPRQSYCKIIYIVI